MASMGSVVLSITITAAVPRPDCREAEGRRHGEGGKQERTEWRSARSSREGGLE
jgi:hypothetical protein